MRRYVLAGLSLSLMLLLGAGALIHVRPTTAQEATEAAPTSILQVVETEPLEGEEISGRTPITIRFDRALDCATLEDSFALAPSLGGELRCAADDNLIRFEPGEDYAPASRYAITLGVDLRGADGSALAEPFTLTLNTIGALAVSDVLPTPDTADVATDTLITVVFNRPVVPLTVAEDTDDLPNPLVISPAVAGEGAWLNTSIYVFEPATPLAGATPYTVTVPAGLTTADGAALPADYAWTFTTAAAQVVEVLPQADSTGIPLDPRLQIVFNQPIDPGSFEQNFFLMAEGEEPVSGEFEWSEDGTGVSFQPDDLLTLGTRYAAGFPDDSVFDASGQTALPPLTWYFTTVPYPAILGTSPTDGQTEVPPYGGMTIYFASPMDIDTFEGRITIEPEPWRAPDFYYNEYDNSLNISFPAQPSADYRITIEPGMEDRYGNAITEPLTFRFTTAPYEPNVALQVPWGGVGFYNAYREPTSLFLLHRNISQIDLALYSVGVEAFAERVLNPEVYDLGADYAPDSDQLLHRWTIASVAPQNALRYELLELGEVDRTTLPEAAPAIDCPGALPTRLNVGDAAIVVTDALRARANPPDGDVIATLYTDNVVSIVSGPICASDILWWQARLDDETLVWVAEGLNDPEEPEYYLALDTPGSAAPLDIPDEFLDDGRLQPGIYFLNATAPETSALGYAPQTHFLVVATANLVMKTSLDSAVIWATDVESGLPIAGAPITVYGEGFTPLAEGVTDETGLLRVDLPRAADLYVPRLAVLDDGAQFGIGKSEWSEGIDPWFFGQRDAYYAPRYSVYMYTDRPIYRPGQPVYYRGVVRLRDDITYTRPDLDTVPLTLYNEMGEVIFTEDVELSAFGTFSGQFEIAPDAGLGYYRLEVSLPSEREFSFEGGSVGFGVAEYRLPEFEVEVTPAEPEVAQGETIEITVDSRYFFGGVVAEADVTYNVLAGSYSFDYSGPGGRYDFMDFDYDAGPGEFYGTSAGLIASGEGVTDENGLFVIEIPADLEDSTQSQTFTVEAVVTDDSGQAVAGRTDVIVHQGLIYVGARPSEYVATEGEETPIELIAVNWEGSPIAGQTLEVEIVERLWSSVQEQDDAGRTTWTYEVEEIPVASGEVVTGDDGRAEFAFTPPNGGVFKAIVTTRDAEGNAIRSATTVWASGRDYVAWRQQNSNRIDLIADQSAYSVGDTAQILITSPFQGTTEALISIERGDVITVDRVTMDSNSTIYEFPILPEYAPNVYVSVVLVKGVDETNPVAAFRAGLAQIGVDAEQQEITIDITPDTDQAGPGDVVTYTVRTTDFEGEPVQAEVGVALTDLASLSIAAPNSGPIMLHFYGQQGLGVRTATPLTINVDQLTQTVLDTIKGGGGGFGEGGIFDIREAFVDTAYWNGALVTAEDGTATFEITLPDNLTTWRLDARAVTAGDDGLTLVGQETFDLLSTKPLLIRPVTPRFFVVGDEVVLAAIVNNNTEAALEVEVALEGTGIEFDGDSVQTIEVAAGRGARVEWPVTVLEAEAIGLTFFARTTDDAYTDASRPPLGQGEARLLPVYRYEAPETVGTGGVLREAGSQTETIALPERFDLTEGTLTVSLEESLAGSTLNSLDYLRSYAFTSIEGMVSAFLPNIATYRALDQLVAENPALEATLNYYVGIAVQRLYAEQKPDGGWGWYVQDASHPIVTAYALIGLAEARAAGFAVDEGVIQRAQGYLAGQFITPGLDAAAWQLDRQAFILYALAYSGAPDVARTATLFDSRDRLSLYATALLADTLHLIDAEDTSRVSTLINDLVNAAIVSANGAHWEEAARDVYNWNTDTRTTAMILRALVRIDPENALIPNTVRWLMTARTADHWETTQETAWSVLALTDFMMLTGELEGDYRFSVALNDETLFEGLAQPENITNAQTLAIDIARLLADQTNALTIERGAGEGALYYTAYLEAYLPVTTIEPLNRGLIVERRYVLLDDPDAGPITEARVGQLIQARLTVIAPNDLYFVVIEDPIPAGADAVNPDLATSQQIGTRPAAEAQNPLSNGWGWWWFSNIQFRDEQIVLSATYLPAGTYEFVYTVRPGLPGVYNVIPATGYETYFPEIYGRSAGSAFTILPADE